MQIIKTKNTSKHEITKKVLDAVRKGYLVVMPSDTVYGLCVDAKNNTAVKNLIAFKSRPAGKAISVFVRDIKQAKQYVHIGKHQEAVLKKILPGEYTVVLPSKGKVCKELESENKSLGIRIPDYALISDVTEKFNRPITATSANISGASPHYSIESFLHSLSEKKKKMIDVVVDAGKIPRRKPSTVLDFTSDTLSILRQGDEHHVHDAHDAYVTHIDYKKKGTTYITKSAKETQSLAQKIFHSHVKEIKDKALVILLYGDLGSGKTVFVKGIGKKLGITDIISPTFVIYYEYDVSVCGVKHGVNKLYHCDLYRMDDDNDFTYLHFDDVIRPGNLICVEWSEKGRALRKILKDANIISVNIQHIDPKTREITVVEGAL